MISSLRPSSRDAIIQAAFELLASDTGVSLADIATRAGVGRATLHRYFSSRDDLFFALAKAAIHDMDDAVEAACKDCSSHSDALYQSLKALVPLGDRYRFLANDTLEEHPDLQADYERQERETVGLVDAAKGEGLFDQAVPTSWIVQSFEHLLYAAWESVTAQQCTPDQATDLAWRTLTNGLGAPS
ncbi:MAG: TetR/AcrR family transcriptional regulator [Pseudomonadota bacterium]